MSSILRALKKLENDSRHIEGNRSLGTKFVPLADTGNRRSAGRIFMMAGTGIICGLVVLAGWYFFSDRLKPRPPEIATHSSPAAEPVGVEPVKPMAQNTSPDTAIAEKPEEKTSGAEQVEPVSAVEESPAVEPAAPEMAAGSVATREEAPSAGPMMPEKTVKAVDAPMQGSDRHRPPADLASEASGKGVQPKAETSSEVEIPKLNDPDMALQAITWSRTPQKRLAVISNRIVREGESVAGYLVSTINQDDVVLSREGEKWRLQFRIK